MTNNNGIVADAVSIPLAGVSTIACIIASGVLLYYKMWRTFIYRLVFYSLLSLIVFSLTNILFVSGYVITEATTIDVNCSNVCSIVLDNISNGSTAIASILVTCVTVCIYLMALHNYQFTYKSDLCLLVPSTFYLVIAVIASTLWDLPQFDDDNYITVIAGVIFGLPIIMNIVFTALTLVPLCCRACGYNLCMKTAATIESHRKALREILPLFILIVPSFLTAVLLVVVLSFGDNSYLELIVQVLFSTLGLVYTLSFAFHLFLIRKKLKKLQGKKKSSSTNQRHSQLKAMFTSYGISESCNTEYLPVSENEEDKRILLRKKGNEDLNSL